MNAQGAIYGLVVRAVACEARGPGFDSSSDPNGFYSLLGRDKMDPDTLDCIILHILVNKINDNS